MFMRLIIFGTLVLAMLFALSASAGEELQPHDPIYIGDDGDFTTENGVISGTGTEEDPYIIEGWEIDATDSPYGIYIEKTEAHFIIRDSKIYGATVQGIRLDGVKNGTIEGCELVGNNVAIWLADSTADRVVKNSLEENFAGIYLFSSTGNEISGNTINATATTGILVKGSADNLLYHNNLSGGWMNAFDDGANKWDNDAQGNYWSDYTGEDVDGDGIGDTPYAIPGGENEDRYPLMEPFSEEE